MRRHKALGLVVFISLLVVGLFVSQWLGGDEIVVRGPAWTGSEIPSMLAHPSTTLTFVGDIMLARDVEKRLLAQSPGYAFKGMGDLLTSDLVVGNFEAAISETHEPTPSMVLRFSVLPRLAAELSNAGFTHLSLANNHTFDFGGSGYANTRTVLGGLGMETAGNPNTVSNSSVFVSEINDDRIVIVNINATYRYPHINEIITVLPVHGVNDTLIAYIHWGEEYELTHNAAQERFAHALIDSGFDLIVGHHPHVVQDIQIFRDKLIFYSLGNFIFDQYWNDDVQFGLVLRLASRHDGWDIELVPVESKTTRIQPRPMAAVVRERFLEALAERSSASLRSDILNGRLSLQF